MSARDLPRFNDISGEDFRTFKKMEIRRGAVGFLLREMVGLLPQRQFWKLAA